ncbi:Fe2+-dependent dioxygenase [Parvularcula marina]|uniref:Fe2+-dependent dioxygenase n=1 Tax=Parvularcula marina TaxID=2292771 RepID=A0A371RGX0_9PROT|nr:Fe2+-dependent dioxygenase [Parvularcula marina]RFB04708.1 Fe2+-dependent dioxygenase [Parvularcula marina]
MLVQIPDVLTPEQVREVRRIIDAGEWVDGNMTSGAQAARAKRNQQLDEKSATTAKAQGIIYDALQQSPGFISAVLPLKVYPPLFNRYQGGESFGNHVDNAIRPLPGKEDRIRTDVSTTLFLCEPDEYEGGELLIDDTYGTHSVKLPAGHAVIYPSTSLHRVAAVTEGARVASFFWTQSMVRDDTQRALLYELDQSIQSLYQTQPDAPEIVRLTGIYHNLIRQWAEV